MRCIPIWQMEALCLFSGNLASLSQCLSSSSPRFIEQFSFVCRRDNWFPTYYATWLLTKKLAPMLHPILNRDAFARVFPRFASATCNYVECRLVHSFVCVLSDLGRVITLVLVLRHSIENPSNWMTSIISGVGRGGGGGGGGVMMIGKRPISSCGDVTCNIVSDEYFCTSITNTKTKHSVRKLFWTSLKLKLSKRFYSKSVTILTAQACFTKS